VASFHSDPATVDEGIERIGEQVSSGEAPAGLEGARMMMLVNRETGETIGITLFDSEEAMRRGDEALNAMTPPVGQRSAVAFFEVPVSTV
jgi:hypothetical protein